MTKRSILLLGVLIVYGLASVSFAQTFPTKDLSGVIQWGAGGATDNVARAVTPLVEKHLGKQVVLQNKPGATGAVAVQWVHNQPSDGYTLLYGAENPLLYRVLDISQLEYKDFYPVTHHRPKRRCRALRRQPALENHHRTLRGRQEEP